MSTEAWFAAIAVALSVATTLVQISLAKHSYLSSSLHVEYPRKDTVTLRVNITNAAQRPKKIGPVFLLLGPIAENPISTFNRLIGDESDPQACCAIDFEHYDLRPLTDSEMMLRRLIPLTYFTEENDNIGDETLTFTYPLRIPDLDRPTAISARLYVFGHAQFGRRLHRKVQNIILLGQESNTSTDEYGLEADELAPCRAACKSLGGCIERSKRTRP